MQNLMQQILHMVLLIFQLMMNYFNPIIPGIDLIIEAYFFEASFFMDLAQADLNIYRHMLQVLFISSQGDLQA